MATNASALPLPPPPSLGRQRTANYHPSYKTDKSKLPPDTKGMDALRQLAAMATTKQAAALAAPAPPRFVFSLGGCTHPGGNTTKPNQDDFFIWRCPHSDTVVIGVLDGHGRELGELASKTAKASFLEAFQSKDATKRIRKAPTAAFTAMFATAHAAIRKAFIMYYEAQGWEVRGEGEVLLKRKPRCGGCWGCVHGGTTATLIVILDTHKVFIANVGDSSALLGGVSLPVRPADYFVTHGTNNSNNKNTNNNSSSSRPLRTDELTANHSPENPDEYRRMRLFRPSPSTKLEPELRFVYDSLSYSKSTCAPIFAHGPSGSLRVTNNGQYYKNVRQEWAALVCTAPGSRFQDALAFTRSCGDFHLQSYGVSHTPEVCCLDLSDAPAGSASSDIFLLLASDGVWDNWVFAEAVAAAAKAAPGGETPTTDNMSQAASQKFMENNLAVALENFGKQADNMTVITCFVGRA